MAETCGFHHEGTALQAWFHTGRHHDVEIFAIVRDAVIPA
jgi:RimJ/RimL family protein N-acetyltransferase